MSSNAVDLKVSIATNAALLRGPTDEGASSPPSPVAVSKKRAHKEDANHARASKKRGRETRDENDESGVFSEDAGKRAESKKRVVEEGDDSPLKKRAHGDSTEFCATLDAGASSHEEDQEEDHEGDRDCGKIANKVVDLSRNKVVLDREKAKFLAAFPNFISNFKYNGIYARLPWTDPACGGSLPSCDIIFEQRDPFKTENNRTVRMSVFTLATILGSLTRGPFDLSGQRCSNPYTGTLNVVLPPMIVRFPDKIGPIGNAHSLGYEGTFSELDITKAIQSLGVALFDANCAPEIDTIASFRALNAITMAFMLRVATEKGPLSDKYAYVRCRLEPNAPREEIQRALISPDSPVFTVPFTHPLLAPDVDEVIRLVQGGSPEGFDAAERTRACVNNSSSLYSKNNHVTLRSKPIFAHPSRKMKTGEVPIPKFVMPEDLKSKVESITKKTGLVYSPVSRANSQEEGRPFHSITQQIESPIREGCLVALQVSLSPRLATTSVTHRAGMNVHLNFVTILRDPVNQGGSDEAPPLPTF